MTRCRIILILIFFCLPGWVLAADTTITRKTYTTQQLIKGNITLDGIPSEPEWDQVAWAGGFTQIQPNPGQPSSQNTRFKILYDNNFLYVAYDCQDDHPDSISKRMGRRDDFPGDWMEINIDSYHDHRNAFSFTVSASGVRGDEFASNDGQNWDGNFNPVWFAKTHINKTGWTAEIKIPLSQLRYSNEKEKVWGIQVHRRIFRRDEKSIWQYIPPNSGTWVSSFAELLGLKDIVARRQFELAPYISTQQDSYKKIPGNPFASGSDTKLTAGIDGKLAVTNNLILDFTVNPDFGQVEADPSQVRIDGFQNFFDEKRPFFIEGSNIFNYQLTGSQSGGDINSDILFYSRRIGSSPHGFVSTRNNEYVKFPQNTSIGGAGKFSGKTANGWSIGVLESVTNREYAIIDSLGKRNKHLVEPRTSYFTGRVQKDIQQGKNIIGMIFTAVNREKGLNDLLHKSAYTGGIDYLHYWKNRQWYIKAIGVASQVSGTKDAILNTQTSFEHLFQRPRAPELKLDSNRTSLLGTGGTFAIGKSGGTGGKMGQVFTFESGFTFRSPQLELNDLGFQLSSNEITQFGSANLRYTKPFAVFTRLNLGTNYYLRWDYNGQMLYQEYSARVNTLFRNYYSMNLGFTFNPYDVSNNALRGAGAIRRPAGTGINFSTGTDNRKKLSGSFNFFAFRGSNNDMNVHSVGLNLYYVPINQLNFRLSSNYQVFNRKQDQFVRNVMYNGTTRTIVGGVNQKSLRIVGRMNYNLTPDLTLQYYGQPFLFRPTYKNFALVTQPLAKKYDDRFTPFTAQQFSYSNGSYQVDENNDAIVDYRFGKPDFNFVQFRSNLVLRWEYRAGSEIYLVWSNNNTANAFDDLHTPVFNSLLKNMFGGDARNSYLLKITYRFLN